jgi:hypothetical protein
MTRAGEQRYRAVALVVVTTARRQAGSHGQHGLGSCGLKPAMSAVLSGLTANWPAARTPVGGVRGIRLEGAYNHRLDLGILDGAGHPRSRLLPKTFKSVLGEAPTPLANSVGIDSPVGRHDLALLAFSAGQDDPSQQRQNLRRAPARRRRRQLSAPYLIEPQRSKASTHNIPLQIRRVRYGSSPIRGRRTSDSRHQMPLCILFQMGNRFRCSDKVIALRGQLKSRHLGRYRLRNTLLAAEASLASYCTPKLPAINSIQHLAGRSTGSAVPHLWHALC